MRQTRSREFLSDEAKLERVDGEDRHMGEGELRYSASTFGEFAACDEVMRGTTFSDWSPTLGFHLVEFN